MAYVLVCFCGWVSFRRRTVGVCLRIDTREKYTYMRPHSHAYPLSGYMSVQAEPSETLFRSPWEEQELFTVDAQNGRINLFPGGVRHATYAPLALLPPALPCLAMPTA